MYTGFLHLHNLLRYVLVILLILALFKSFAGWFSKKQYSSADDKISLYLLITAHLQLLIGLALYLFLSPVAEVATSDMGAAMKDPVLRFWAVEHLSAMVLGIILITLGRIMGKKGSTDNARFRRQAIYYLLATVLIFSAIPWPWSAIARPWF